MREEDNAVLVGIVLIILGIISIIGICFYGTYHHKELEVENFQKTIGNLTEEQKCLHICGFEWQGSTFFDNYKYCVEKCDRISERSIACNTGV